MTPRTLAAEMAVPAQCELAEGPVWDAARGLLRWVDILPGHVHALDPATGAHTMFEADPDTGALSGRRRFVATSGGLPDGLTLDAEGGLWLAVWGSSELRRYTPD